MPGPTLFDNFKSRVNDKSTKGYLKVIGSAPRVLTAELVWTIISLPKHSFVLRKHWSRFKEEVMAAVYGATTYYIWTRRSRDIKKSDCTT